MALVAGGPGAAAAAQPPSQEQQEEFVPLDELPPEDQLASGPTARALLVGAYVFVVAALFLYLLSVARRITAVAREVERLEADLKRSGRS